MCQGTHKSQHGDTLTHSHTHAQTLNISHGQDYLQDEMVTKWCKCTLLHVSDVMYTHVYHAYRLVDTYAGAHTHTHS